MLPLLDALAPGVLVAQAVGRWGNWFNQELYGRPTDLPWGLEIDVAHRPSQYLDQATFHPAFLYECLWNLAAFALLIWLDRRFRLGHGRVAALYVMLYTLGRGWIENLRIDDVQMDDVMGLRLNVWTSIVLFVLAAAWFIWSAVRHPGREDVVRTREPEVEHVEASDEARPSAATDEADEARPRTARPGRAHPGRTSCRSHGLKHGAPAAPAGDRFRLARANVVPSGNFHPLACRGPSEIQVCGARRRRRENASMHAFPPSQGLYDPRHEKDACGVAMVATLTGEASHDIVAKALTALRNLDHRGAAGAEVNSGDGAGILMQVPDAFLREVVDFDLPPARAYAVGTAFLPGDAEAVAKTRQRIEEIADEEGLTVLGWRELPVDDSTLGATARSVMPSFAQVFVAGRGARVSGMALERLRLLPAQARRVRDRGLLPLALLAHPGLQGHAHHRPARPGLPRPDRRAGRLRDGGRALALLHEHLPELAAGPPVPVHRPQRRDQHRDGQPQLDARPRGAPRERPDPRRPRADLPDLHARAPRTPRRSTRSSSCCTSPAARCRTRC